MLKHPLKYYICLVLLMVSITFLACSGRQTKDNTETPKQEKKVTQASDSMRIAFYYPVVMVNGKRTQKKESDYQEWIEMSFPQNSTNPIVLSIIDTQGVEHELRGEIKVEKYTEYSQVDGNLKPLVVVAPENAEYTYINIIKNGYGELSIREEIDDPEKGRIKGAVLAQLMLGTKKKNDNRNRKSVV